MKEKKISGEDNPRPVGAVTINIPGSYEHVEGTFIHNTLTAVTVLTLCYDVIARHNSGREIKTIFLDK
jgi:hypothetical protein